MTRFTSRTSGLIGLASMVILSVYVLTVITNVLSRYLLDAPLPLLSDFGELLVPAALALVFPAAALNGKNLAIRFLGQGLGVAGFAALEVFSRLVTAALLLLIAWRLGDYSLETFANGHSTAQYSIPVWPVWGFVCLAFFTAAVGVMLAPSTKFESDG